MRLVEIDIVGLEPAQALLAGADDVLAAEPGIIGSRAHFPATFSRQHDPLAGAARLDPAPNNFLGGPGAARRAAKRVDIGGIEERDAGLVGHVHNAKRGRLVGLVAERHRAQADLADFEAGAA